MMNMLFEDDAFDDNDYVEGRQFLLFKCPGETPTFLVMMMKMKMMMSMMPSDRNFWSNPWSDRDFGGRQGGRVQFLFVKSIFFK